MTAEQSERAWLDSAGREVRLYHVADKVPLDEQRSLGVINPQRPIPSLGVQLRSIRGVCTLEVRPPRAGEYYLSGAIPEVYRAPEDLTTAYRICRLVRIEEVTTLHIIAEQPARPSREEAETADHAAG